jgi:hypothetical protein
MTSIRITSGNYFIARPIDTAPRTVAAFSALLPYRQKIIHVRWSGEACWIPLGDFDLQTGFENHTSYPAAGKSNLGEQIQRLTACGPLM